MLEHDAADAAGQTPYVQKACSDSMLTWARPVTTGHMDACIMLTRNRFMGLLGGAVWTAATAGANSLAESVRSWLLSSACTPRRYFGKWEKILVTA